VKREIQVCFLIDSLDRRSTFRSADVTMYGWVGGKHACVDLHEFSPLVRLGVKGFTVGQTTLKVASRKVAK